MPYEIRKVGDEYCVFNKETDKKKGCSETKAKAEAHMRALYHAEGGGEFTKAKVSGSLEDELQAIRDSFYNSFQTPSMIGQPAYPSDIWVENIFEGYVIARASGGKLYKVPYSKKKEGIEFALPEEWVEVEVQYVETKAISPAADIETDFDFSIHAVGTKAHGDWRIGEDFTAQVELLRSNVNNDAPLEDSETLQKAIDNREAWRVNFAEGKILPSGEGEATGLPMTFGGAEKGGVRAPMDKGVAEYGAQLSDLKEFFLQGERWKGRLVFHMTGLHAAREVGWPIGESQELHGEAKAHKPIWVCVQPADQTPYVLSAEAVGKNWMPPEGVSCIPMALRESTPIELRFWEMQGDAAIEARRSLASIGDEEETEMDGQEEKVVELVEAPWFQKLATKVAEMLGLKERVLAQQEKSFFVTKQQEDGRFRWLSVSSTAFYDRDDEIVSRAALQKAVGRAHQKEDHGRLQFFHFPMGKEGSFGGCDFAMVDGACLVESGLWDETPLAEAARKSVEANPERWGISIGFYPKEEPATNVVINGVCVKQVWGDIEIVERSILPIQFAANTFTSITTEGGIVMDQEKQKALTDLVGEDLAKEFAARVDEINKEATEPLAITKDAETETEGTEETPPAEVAPSEEVLAVLKEIGKKLSALEAEVQKIKAADAPRAADHRASVDPDTAAGEGKEPPPAEETKAATVLGSMSEHMLGGN